MKLNAEDLEAAKMSISEIEAQRTADRADLNLADQSLVEYTVAFTEAKQDSPLRAAEFPSRHAKSVRGVGVRAQEHGLLRNLQKPSFTSTDALPNSRQREKQQPHEK